MPATAIPELIDHYRRTARDLPWRTPPGSDAKPDPYKVWLSEIMLQQTTVATVTPRYQRFLDRWPSVEALAAAPLEDVLSEWAGLGYYARARNLHACAKEVAARGGFPATERELRALPGIGDYTAAAIAAIAFGQQATVIDTNVERIVARLHAIDRPIKESRAQIRTLAAGLFTDGPSGDIAQALMDLGATICRPKRPRCEECPLASVCKAKASGTPEAYPPKPAKKAKPERHGTAWIIHRKGAIFLVRRPDKGLLGGMAALPGTSWNEGEAAPAARLAVRHVFTHFALTLRIESRNLPPPRCEGWWQPIDRLDEAGLPTLYTKAIKAWDAAEREPSLIA